MQRNGPPTTCSLDVDPGGSHWNILGLGFLGSHQCLRAVGRMDRSDVPESSASGSLQVGGTCGAGRAANSGQVYGGPWNGLAPSLSRRSVSCALDNSSVKWVYERKLLHGLL